MHDVDGVVHGEWEPYRMEQVMQEVIENAREQPMVIQKVRRSSSQVKVPGSWAVARQKVAEASVVEKSQ